MPRMGSPVMGSILITRAPMSASTAPALGAAIQLSISSTTTSSNGAAMLGLSP